MKNLMIYRKLPREAFFQSMTELMDEAGNWEAGRTPSPEKYEQWLGCVHELITLAEQYGFCGRLWPNAVAWVLANAENVFSISCEKRGARTGSLELLARQDLAVWKKWIDFPFAQLDACFGTSYAELLTQYDNPNQNGHMFNKRIRDEIEELGNQLLKAEDTEAVYLAVTEFYRKYGVGKLGLHKAFRVEHQEERVSVEPISCVQHVHLDHLVGCELQKKKLRDNTRSFVEGRPANNVLLFGDAGTGKSTCIKAIMNEFYEQGLRLIEVYKHQFQDLNAVIAQIKNRNYRFIIYMDDLSFEEFEIEYKYLKAVIEGGLETKPENVLIYATSNRRHLIKESFRDMDDQNQELHSSDTVQEKLSLVARFGVTIYFGSPDPMEFQEIVSQLAERNEIRMEREQLLLEANRWELSHGGLSGRTAQQFITYLKGQQEVKNGGEAICSD